MFSYSSNELVIS